MCTPSPLCLPNAPASAAIRSASGQDVWLGLEYTAYTIGYLLHSTDYGATWVAPAWHPFSVGGDISSIVIVDAQNGYRVIVCGRNCHWLAPPKSATAMTKAQQALTLSSARSMGKLSRCSRKTSKVAFGPLHPW